MRITSSLLEERIARLFDAPHSGWELARYSTADILVAAMPGADVTAEWLPVLGEIHIGYVDMGHTGVMALCPVADEIRAARAADTPSRCVYARCPRVCRSA